MSQLFTSGGQSIGASASASVLPMSIQGLFLWGLTGLISSVQGTLKSLLQHHSSKASILWCSAFFMVQLSHPYRSTGKTIALTIWTFVGKVILSFLMLSGFNPWVGKIPWRRERLLAQRIPWIVWSMASQRVGHDWAMFTLTFRFVIAFLPRSRHLLISWLQ